MKPMVKKNRGLKEASWDEAFDYAADKLKLVMKAHGPQSVAVFGSPRMTNEELYLLQKFVRTGLKSNNIGSFTNVMNGMDQDALDGMFGLTTSTTTMDEIKCANVVVVIGSDISEDNLIAELKVKEAQKAGTLLVTINSTETPLTRLSDFWISPKRGTSTALINGISKAVIDKGAQDKKFVEAKTGGFEAFKKSVAKMDGKAVSAATGVDAGKLTELFSIIADKKNNVVALYSIDSRKEKSTNDLKALANLFMLTGRVGKAGNGIIILRDFANSQGLFDMGADSRYLPGNVGGKGRGGNQEDRRYVGQQPGKTLQARGLQGRHGEGQVQGLRDLR